MGYGEKKLTDMTRFTKVDEKFNHICALWTYLKNQKCMNSIKDRKDNQRIKNATKKRQSEN